MFYYKCLTFTSPGFKIKKIKITNILKLQTFPFHLVQPSPWPILTSFALLTLTVSAVMYFHGYENGGYLLTLGALLTTFAMILWFRDVILEGTKKIASPIKYHINCFNILKIARVVFPEEINEVRKNYSNEYLKNKLNFNKEQLGFYLAGLLEGDGNISLPYIGKSKLTRILNPRIVFTFHINNLGLYSYIQQELMGIGRFQKLGNNSLRYIIGDKNGIINFIELVRQKLRTPKNDRFNLLIEFINLKYNLAIENSVLDTSSIFRNNWFAGFVEADGQFCVKYRIAKPESEGQSHRKRMISESVSILFRLDQRSYDVATGASMSPMMDFIASYLNCNVLIFKYKALKSLEQREVLSISITSLNHLKLIIEYFNNYPLLGTKYLDFKDWEEIYYMISSKEHLTESGRAKIKNLSLNMNSKRNFRE